MIHKNLIYNLTYYSIEEVEDYVNITIIDSFLEMFLEVNEPIEVKFNIFDDLYGE